MNKLGYAERWPRLLAAFTNGELQSDDDPEVLLQTLPYSVRLEALTAYMRWHPRRVSTWSLPDAAKLVARAEL